MRLTLGMGRAFALIGICGAMGGACSGGDGGSGGSSGPVALSQLPTAMADAYCNALLPCCASAGVPVSAATCKQFFEQGLQTSLDSARPENFEYDAVAAGQCLDDVRSLGGNCGDFASSASANPICADVFNGRLAPGETCESDVECSLDGADDVDCDETDGICLVERRGVAGDPCYWTCTEEGSATSCSGGGGEETPDQSRCFINDGLYCSAESVCTAQGSIGEPCDGDDGCSADAYCEFSSGTCAARLTEGAECTFNECAEGLYCKESACVPELEPGSSCVDFDDECRNGSCDEGTCKESGDLGNVGIALACALLGGGLTTSQ